MPTFRACSRACSSSSACCFSFSSMRLKDMPVVARVETALDRVDALQGGGVRHLYESLKEKDWGGEGVYLVSALSSLVFLPSREARCCSRASRRLLGA